MKRLFADMNPTLRGFLIVLAIALVIFVFQLDQTLTALFLLVRVAFLLAIAFFVYLVWRERRAEIAMWSRRAQWTFYGAALLIVADFFVYFFRPLAGPDAAAFLVVLAVAGFSMWRVWRDAHTYS